MQSAIAELIIVLLIVAVVDDDAIIAVNEPVVLAPLHPDVAKVPPKRVLTPTLEIKDWRKESDQVSAKKQGVLVT